MYIFSIFSLGLGLLCVHIGAFSPPKYSKCISKDFGQGGTVCLCSENECDSFSEGIPLGTEEYAVYTSSKAGERFSLKTAKFEKSFTVKSSVEDVRLMVNSSVRFQKILGFGGAFTDAASINIYNISTALRQKLLSSYFSEEGIEYNIGRIPMASCDFSTRPYSYNDHVGDLEMANFSLVDEDVKLKIPLMLTAMKMSKKNITFFGSPWSAPAWMKTNNKMTGFGQLKGKAGDKNHKAWALYFAKFIEAYKEKGIKIWAVTAQNEPSDGFIPFFSFQCMGYTAAMERDFIKEDLGPMLSARGHADVKIIMLDDQRMFLKSWANTVLTDPDAAKYVAGIGVHWYEDIFLPAKVLSDTHNRFPDYFILATEACIDPHLSKPPIVSLGNWARGNRYSHSIIEDLSNWAVGWVDWNIALNMEGGPNWVKNFVDSPIIVDAENGLFYKQPMFYHLGHFSKFVPPGSQRIEVTASGKSSLQFIGFTTPAPSMSTVVIILNKDDFAVELQINSQDGTITETVPPSSIQTYIW